ncbi:MAG: DUF305 domain-containing protein [Alphaproteobacteria bacterium]|nr:MAG: DUF305 domain-containing protein [Alphaproteobacteria bacterium]
MKTKYTILILAVAAFLSAPVMAAEVAAKAEKAPLPTAPAEKMQKTGDSHSGHAVNSASQSASTQAFEKAAAEMHSEMMIAYTGDADVDFVRGMIPHHQGAIDMAKVVLQYGKDAEIKKLAQGIIAAQETEIAQMKAWLKSHDKNPSKAN